MLCYLLLFSLCSHVPIYFSSYTDVLALLHLSTKYKHAYIQIRVRQKFLLSLKDDSLKSGGLTLELFRQTSDAQFVA